MADPRFNIVHFSPPEGDDVAILLEGAFKLTAGVKPNVTRATCSYKEYAKIGDSLDVTGSLDFYFTSDDQDPDLSIDQVSLVDAEPLEWGKTPESKETIVTKYRLFFADQRRQFLSPRGGRLRLGLLNPSTHRPKEDPTGAEVQSPKEFSELIQFCLDAMGIDCEIPSDVDDIDAPQDLKWFGSHAPTELAKLLQAANAALLLQPDGTFEIHMIGQGDEPKIPDGQQLPTTTLSGADVRGKTVVFSSYPTQQVVVLTEADLPDEAWQIVYFDKDGKWKPIDKSLAYGKILKGQTTSSAMKEMNNHFSETPDPKAQWGCYRYLRLDPQLFDPVISPLLRKTYDMASKPGQSDDYIVGGLPPEIDLQLQAKVAVQDPTTGLWKNATDLVNVPVMQKLDENILVTALRLVKLKDGVSVTNDVEANCVPLDPNTDMKFRIAVGDAEWDSEKQVFSPQYFHVGFRRGDGEDAELERIENDDAEAAMETADTLVVPIAELLAVRFTDEPFNKQELQDRCQAMADRYLKDASRPPKIIAGVGFFDFMLSGVAPEAEIDQQSLITRFRINNWFRPSGSYSSREARKLEHPHESHPHEAKTQGRKTARAEAGSNQPVEPVSHYFGAGGSTTMFIAALENDGGSDSDGTKTAGWTYTIRPLSGGDPLAIKVPLFRQRQFPVVTRPATHGLVFVVGDDDFVSGKNPNGGKQLYRIWDCDEIFASGQCDLTAFE